MVSARSGRGATPQERSAAARARLLAAAGELFYAEGVQSVGIDRVIEHAGVAKATLYSAFGSKDGLVRAYLQARHDATRERMRRELGERFPSARERLVGVFEVQGLTFTDPGFRGCAFVSAKAEARPGGVVDEAADEYRAWLHTLFFELARDAGARDARHWPSSSCCCTTERGSAPGWTTTPVRSTPPGRWPQPWSTPRYRRDPEAGPGFPLRGSGVRCTIVGRIPAPPGIRSASEEHSHAA